MKAQKITALEIWHSAYCTLIPFAVQSKNKNSSLRDGPCPAGELIVVGEFCYWCLRVLCLCVEFFQELPIFLSTNRRNGANCVLGIRRLGLRRHQPILAFGHSSRPKGCGLGESWNATVCFQRCPKSYPKSQVTLKGTRFLLKVTLKEPEKWP